MANSSDARLIAIYEQTSEMFRLLADLRFRLLAFVPTLCAAAITLLTASGSPKPNPNTVAVGLLGFVVTLGILIYELRNTGFYERASQDLKDLRAELLRGSNVQLPESRPGKQNLFGVFSIWHDRALALVYGTALGGWSYIVLVSLRLQAGEPREAAASVSLELAALVAVAFFWQIEHLDLIRSREWGEAAPGPRRRIYAALSTFALFVWLTLFLAVFNSGSGKFVSDLSKRMPWLPERSILPHCIVLLVLLGLALWGLRASIKRMSWRVLLGLPLSSPCSQLSIVWDSLWIGVGLVFILFLRDLMLTHWTIVLGGLLILCAVGHLILDTRRIREWGGREFVAFSVSPLGVDPARVLKLTALEPLRKTHDINVILDVARNVSVTGNLERTSGEVIIRGRSKADEEMHETVTANGRNPVWGDKAFARVTQIELPAQTDPSDAISVGVGYKIGLPRTFSWEPVILGKTVRVDHAPQPAKVRVDAKHVCDNTIELAALERRARPYEVRADLVL